MIPSNSAVVELLLAIFMGLFLLKNMSLFFTDILIKNNTYVGTRSKLAGMNFCQQQEETVGLKEQVQPEKSYHGDLGCPVDPGDMILKLHQKFLTGHNWKPGQSTFSLWVVLSGVTELGVTSRD